MLIYISLWEFYLFIFLKSSKTIKAETGDISFWKHCTETHWLIIMSAHYLCMTTSSSTKPCLLVAVELFLFKCVEWCSSVSAGNETPRGELVFVYLCWSKRKALSERSGSQPEHSGVKFRDVWNDFTSAPRAERQDVLRLLSFHNKPPVNLPQHADAENTHAALQRELLLFRCSQVNLFMSTYKTAIITAYGWHAQRSATVLVQGDHNPHASYEHRIWRHFPSPCILGMILATLTG